MSKKQSKDNVVIVAAAGAGKTTRIVTRGIENSSERVLITTYTNENADQIRSLLITHARRIPENVTVIPWFTFLLQHGVRPYQNQLTAAPRARSIRFQSGGSIYHKKEKWFTKERDIYSNKLAEFAVECNKIGGGKVIRRLERIFDTILVDEVQDLAGYDLDFLEMLFDSSINVMLVGDPRQATFTTNYAGRNRKFRRAGITKWFDEMRSKKKAKMDTDTCSHRCNQEICDFADSIYPKFEKTVSANGERTGHDGIFRIPSSDVKDYLEQYDPVILRFDKRTDTHGLSARNIGLSKGRTFARVLIFPTKPMKAFLDSGNPEKAGDRSRLYIAVTRACFSVAFVFD